MSDKTQNFLVSVLYLVVLPLVPFFVELISEEFIALSSYLLFSSVYIIVIGTASKNKALFALCLVVALILSMLNGVKDYQTTNIFPLYSSPVSYCLIIIATMHVIERWNRHIESGEPF